MKTTLSEDSMKVLYAMNQSPIRKQAITKITMRTGWFDKEKTRNILNGLIEVGFVETSPSRNPEDKPGTVKFILTRKGEKYLEDSVMTGKFNVIYQPTIER